jgi:hypothetical protein
MNKRMKYLLGLAVAGLWCVGAMAQPVSPVNPGVSSTGGTPTVENTNAYPINPENAGGTSRPFRNPLAKKFGKHRTTAAASNNRPMVMSSANGAGTTKVYRPRADRG